MKKIFALMLTIAMLLTAGAALAEAPGNQLGFAALSALTDGTKNQVLSPVSLAYALAMAAEGADGATERELEKVLGTDDLDDWAEKMTVKLNKAGLKLANAAFVAGELKVDPDYIESLREDFAAEWFEMSDDLKERVNAWASEHTDGLIDQLIDGEISPMTQLMLLNAVAMDAKWDSPFNAENTQDGIFHAPEGDVTVPMMFQELHAAYAEIDGAQLLRLTYADSDLSMLIALPGEDGDVAEILNGLNERGLGYFLPLNARIANSLVALTLPKVDLSVGNLLNDVLQAQGIVTAFSDQADFSDITKEMPLQIGEVLQKAHLIIDEEGTKAAAVTEVGIETMSAMPEEPVAFTADRPFVVVIADEASETVCFAGVIANPEVQGE